MSMRNQLEVHVAAFKTGFKYGRRFERNVQWAFLFFLVFVSAFCAHLLWGIIGVWIGVCRG